MGGRVSLPPSPTLGSPSEISRVPLIAPPSLPSLPPSPPTLHPPLAARPSNLKSHYVHSPPWGCPPGGSMSLNPKTLKPPTTPPLHIHTHRVQGPGEGPFAPPHIPHHTYIHTRGLTAPAPTHTYTHGAHAHTTYHSPPPTHIHTGPCTGAHRLHAHSPPPLLSYTHIHTQGPCTQPGPPSTYIHGGSPAPAPLPLCTRAVLFHPLETLRPCHHV